MEFPYVNKVLVEALQERRKTIRKATRYGEPLCNTQGEGMWLPERVAPS
jgi:hypothetical protein